MLDIKKFEVNALRENCYVVSDETKECVLIDCGAYDLEEFQDIANYIKENELKPVRLLATHGHIDHNFGNDYVLKEYGLKVEVHEKDKKLMESMRDQAQMIFGMTLNINVPQATVGHYFTEEDTISFGNHQFTIIETPGHSMGSVFFYCEAEKVAFSGDTLFRGSIGRTDFMGGSMFQIIQSLRMVCQMDDDIKVYPGHGDETSIGYECMTNKYLDR